MELDKTEIVIRQRTGVEDIFGITNLLSTKLSGPGGEDGLWNVELGQSADRRTGPCPTD